VVEEGDGNYAINAAEGYVRVARVSGVNPAEALANARLMAAGKEMLGALFVALDALEGKGDREEAITGIRALVRKMNDTVPPRLEDAGLPG
jgi:hypothetical protein